jgi:hypothetical protein
MCDICDGMTHDESNLKTMRAIDQYGWSVVGVQCGPRVGWAYTIGLLESFDHPELVVVGLDWPGCGVLLNHLGEQVRAGRPLYPGLEFPDDGIELGVVAPEQWQVRETFAGWLGYYAWRGDAPTEPAAVQVFVDGTPRTRRLLFDDPTSDVRTLLSRPPRRSPRPR